MQTQTNLVRKQYLISESNIRKIEMLASAKGASAAEIVRRAIDAYDPHGAADMEAPELMQVVHERLKDAITATRKAKRQLTRTLDTLDAGRS